ncbi:MAG: hypothetical protein A3G38_04080 [Omnitrophica WOR_2 bacterium RIFCSPLOWO2_12_FULL_51_8]|nr:MAG: hypothetical protein A3G38_04080 [Omnitrophica WOR_2 bacterium RIFCSPLOWO2_12_FULL_51_8]
MAETRLDGTRKDKEMEIMERNNKGEALSQHTQYYQNKLDVLVDVFGAKNVQLADDSLLVDGKRYPIVDDVIILIDPLQYPPIVRERLQVREPSEMMEAYAPDIQDHYSKFWDEWPGMQSHYEQEFNGYFDLIDLSTLRDKRVCDLGCGMGRWSYMLAERVRLRELVLVDFSEAIFTARRLFHKHDNVLFIMGDILRLPFRPDYADFIMSLGVLHHLPDDCLKVVRSLKPYAQRLLVYLYYALDNKPFYYRWLLRAYTPLRRLMCHIHSPHVRVAFSWFAVIGFYIPFIVIGSLLRPFGLSKYVPLYDEHHWAELEGMRHSAYDRFFTRIEQRVTRRQIESLRDSFSKVSVADGQAYWHFVCER